MLTGWQVVPALCSRGGPVRLPRGAAPLGRRLPYRRARGEEPPGPTPLLEQVRGAGWSLEFSGWQQDYLGDFLLGLAAAQALAETGGHGLVYRGRRTELMRRCSLPVDVVHHDGPASVSTRTGEPVRVIAAPPLRLRLRGETGPPPHAPLWLDHDDQDVVVHSALPMRYYLQVEQDLGVRLRHDHAPAPTFSAAATVRPRHVVFVATTSSHDVKQYGYRGFAAIGAALAERAGTDLEITVIVDQQYVPDARAAFAGVAEPSVLAGIDAADCVEVFASAELVIGNDTGLTHLAALTVGADGGGPEVIGLYARHSHRKWTTGTARHHAVAAPLAQMLALADGDLWLDGVDGDLWGTSATLGVLPPDVIAEFACLLKGE